MSVGCNPQIVTPMRPSLSIAVECEGCGFRKLVSDQSEATKVATDHLDKTIRKLRAYLRSGC